MPPKGKAAAKPKEAEKSASKSTSSPALPSTLNERTVQRIEATDPYAAKISSGGLSSLSPAERLGWINTQFAQSARLRSRLSNKVQRDLWRQVNEASLPVRTLHPPRSKSPVWGKDKTGRDVGTYSIAQFDERTEKRARLTALIVASRAFEERRGRSRRGVPEPLTGEETIVTETDIDDERSRRREMAKLRAELYDVHGERKDRTGTYAQDPEWDDVLPIALDEPEGALARIAYPDDYEEAISYLRAVMLKKEYSHRCLRLTEHIIKLNPAHYTVWLYRASIIFALKIPIPDEIDWLNQVALENLKNYQIWHHRHLLIDNYYPTIADDKEKVAELAAAETDFMAKMFEEDTKNYHVWSYRSYLVRKLGLWRMADERERKSIEEMINEDVRNNSAWSHRFFIVFSDPENSTPGSGGTEYDAAVPAEIVDMEIAYAQNKTRLAPQNQSPWNYLKAVLVKGGRKLATVEDFTQEFVKALGDDEKEVVKSTHALDLLAEIHAEKGEKEKADLCLRRLAETWDPIRAGYWNWRRRMLEL